MRPNAPRDPAIEPVEELSNVGSLVVMTPSPQHRIQFLNQLLGLERHASPGTVPSANTLVRWVNENAFAFIVQARPCPTFGRPVAPIDYSPVLLLMPFGFHLAMDTLPSGDCKRWLQVRLGCLQLSPS